MTAFRCDDCGARYYTAATDAATVCALARDGCDRCGGSCSTELAAACCDDCGAPAVVRFQTDGRLRCRPCAIDTLDRLIVAVLAKSTAHSTPEPGAVQKHRYLPGSEAA